MSKLKAYPKYKDSGVEWLGEIPKDWGIGPVRQIFMERGETNEGIKTEQVLSVMKDIGVIPYEEKGNVGNKKSENIEGYKIVKSGDLVINKMNAIIGSLGVSKYNGALSKVYFVLKNRNTSRFDTEYFGYLFRIRTFQKSFAQISKGIMELRRSIDFNEFKNLLLPVPSSSTQNEISLYLNKKNKLIDLYIKKLKKEIELLKEYRQKIISQAVTCGLDEDGNLREKPNSLPEEGWKDSGVEWLKTVPENWELRKIKFLIDEINGIQIGPFGSSLKADYLTESGYKVYGQTNVISNNFQKDSRYVNSKKYKELQKYEVLSGDLLITMMGTTGDIAEVPDKIQPGIMDSHLIRLRLNEQLENSYLIYLFKGADYISSQILILGKGAIMHGLNTTIIKNISVLLPTIQEQQRISRYLDNRTKKIDQQIEKIQQQIEFMQEYKQSLISNVVTGKVDVRNVSIN